MKYRTFGKTGLEISLLGFGCMRFPVMNQDSSLINEKEATAMVRHAIDQGVNYFDTAYPYHAEDFSKPGASETFLSRALKDGYREKVKLATKLPCWLVEQASDMERILNEQLDRLDTESIDFYLLHSLNRKTWDKLLDFGVLEFLDKAIASGLIKYAGFSFHDELPLFKEIVDAYDWAMCQIMYNYYDEDFQAGKEGLVYAAERNIAVVAMEPLRGGALVNGLPEEAKSVLRDADPEKSEADWAISWLMDQPGVSMVLSGMSHMDHVVENLDIVNRFSADSWKEENTAIINKVRQIISRLQKVNCTSCGYCLPCPEGVNIPRNFSLFNDHHMLNDPSARIRYMRLLSEVEKASNCTRCGECLEKCPQEIAIPDEMEEVAAQFNS